MITHWYEETAIVALQRFAQALGVDLIEVAGQIGRGP